MQNKLFCLLFFIHFVVLSQISITGKVIDQSTNTPLPFATVKTDHNAYALTSSTGEFVIRCDSYPVNLTISYVGYDTKKFSIKSEDVVKVEIQLSPKQEDLETVNLDIPGSIASNIIKQAISNKDRNNPNKALSNYSYKTYNKFKITEDNQARFETPDTTGADMERIFNDAHSFLSEKVSLHQFNKGRDEKETVLASRMTGFNKPVYNVLGIKIQSNSLYKENYVIFNNRYAGPLSNRALKNYYYKVLDTTQGKRPAYVILFQPRRSKRIASLEGVLYLDMETLAIQKAVAELRGELNVLVNHNFEYNSEENLWFPLDQEVTIRPGIGKQKVTLFGGQISVGRLGNDKKSFTGNNDFLISKTDFFDYDTKPDAKIKIQQSAIEIAPDATNRSEEYWKKYRTSAITEKDLKSFTVVDSIVQAQNIERRIDVIQSFNIGYYPVGFLILTSPTPLNITISKGCVWD